MLSAGRPVGFVLCLSSLAVAGCAFDSDGVGFSEGASIGDESSTSDGSTGANIPADETGGPLDPTTTTRGDVPGDEPVTASGATSGATSGDEGDAGAGGLSAEDSAASRATAVDEGTTGDPDAGQCPTSVLDLYWVEQAQVMAPMELIAAEANDNPEVASSTVAEAGAVTVSLEFECPGEYTLWGLVWDYDPGAWAAPDPDSFYFDVGGAESTWRYGCQTTEASSGLSWQRMASLAAQPCEASYVVLQVFEAGTVELTLRNREAGDGSAVAGLAAIVVSDDPDADPATLYAPY